MHLAFNGLPLAISEDPDAALHLTDLLERLPSLAPSHRYTLLLPDGEASRSWDRVETIRVERGESEWDRLRLEQWGLGRAARSVGADILYFPYAAAPVSSPVPVVTWNCCAGDRPHGRGPIARLRATLGAAGMAGSVGLIAQEDPGREERTSGQRVHVPPVVPPAFGPERQLRDHKAAKLQGLPSAYVLSVCGCPEDAGLLLAAWTWVASAIGDRIALAVMAGSQAARQIQAGLGRLGLEGSVAVLEAHRGDDLPAIYGNAEAFLFAGWGRIEEAVRRALAAGLPIVGSQTAESARVVGDAGYLVPRRDARLLGAACLTVLVETTVADRLREAAERRGAPLMSEAPLLMCLSCLERVAAMG